MDFRYLFHPMAVIIFTGLILSFQPILQTSGIRPGSISLVQIEGCLATHDPEGKARGLRIDHFEKTLAIQGSGPSGLVEIDLKTGGNAEGESWIGKWTS